MSHNHEIIDTDVHYRIDGITRTIVNINEVKRQLVQNDHKSERLTFEIPRFIDGHDFSECNLVQIHYENKDTREVNKSIDIYTVDDLHIKNDDENVVLLSWLINNTATKYVGTLDFTISFSCVDIDGNITYMWNTTTFKGITILPGIFNSQKIIEENPDILAKLLVNYKNAIEEIELLKRGGSIEELIDVRKSFDGIIYDSAGIAVRTQFENLNGYFETVIGRNLYNSEKIESATVMYANGVKYQNLSDYLLTDYIPVIEGRKVCASYTYTANNNHMSAQMRYITAFNSNKEVITELGTDANVKVYTVPEGVAYIRVSINKAFWNNFQLTYDTATLPYEPYKETVVLKHDNLKNITEDKIEDGAVTENKIAENAITQNKIVKRYYCSMPDILPITVGQVTKIYYANLCSLPKMSIRFKPSSTLSPKCMSDHLEITANAEGNYVIYWHVYDDNYQLVESGETTVIAKSLNLANTTVLVLGDSTVNAGEVTQTMLNAFNETGKVLTLLGTRNSNPNAPDNSNDPNRHEGRGGWTAESYCTNQTLGDYTNAFLNPETNSFDFSYYMAQQGYSGVEYVVIQLGINDTFAFTFENYKSDGILGHFETIINSILTFDENIKIILNITIPPNSNVDTFGNAYGGAQMAFVYRANVIRFAKELMERFESNPNITLCSTNVVIDTATQIRDGVHPTDEGYEAMGNQVINTLNYLQNN